MGREARRSPAGADPLLQPLERAWHAANTVVNLCRPVEGDNDVVHQLGHGVGMLGENQAGGEKRGSNAQVAQLAGQSRQVRGHQGLAAGEDHPAHAQLTQASKVRLQVGGGDLTNLANPPDVAHHAAAVAAAMGKEHQDGQFADVMRRECGGRIGPGRKRGGAHVSDLSSTSTT